MKLNKYGNLKEYKEYINSKEYKALDIIIDALNYKQGKEYKSSVYKQIEMLEAIKYQISTKQILIKDKDKDSAYVKRRKLYEEIREEQEQKERVK